MKRRVFLRNLGLSTAVGAAMPMAACEVVPGKKNLGPGLAGLEQVPAFTYAQKSVAELQVMMSTGALTAAELTQAYLDRIEALNRQGPQLKAVIETNPEAIAIAQQLDEERTQGKSRGGLHGIPILVKDNIGTADQMHTSAGSLALQNHIAPADAFIVARLREAGAVILGKANMSEWANFRSTRSSSGWSARGGQCRNPHVLDRSPCGSSSGSGVAVAAELCALAIGTETDGSIICPSTVNGIVGIKPTLGLWSRSGIIPLSHSQDTAGPMARSVADAAALLGACAGADPQDEATAKASSQDYTQYLREDALKGARLGVLRANFGFHEAVDALMQTAMEQMEAAGAELIELTDFNNGGWGNSEYEVLLYEFKADVAAWCAAQGPDFPYKGLEDFIAYNTAHETEEMHWFKQEIFEMAVQKGPLTEQAYQDALAANHQKTRTEGLDQLFATHQLDAVIAPSGGPAWPVDRVTGDHFLGGSSSLCAVAGYPHITVPAGFVHQLPVGLSFMGLAWQEARLVGLAYAYEQLSQAHRPPAFLTTLF